MSYSTPYKVPREYVKHSEGYYVAIGLIDSEWESLRDMDADDLWDYLVSYKPCVDQGLTRDESDYLFHTHVK